jgi:hypothetical protein
MRSDRSIKSVVHNLPRFGAAMKRSLPGLPDADLYWDLHLR